MVMALPGQSQESKTEEPIYCILDTLARNYIKSTDQGFRLPVSQSFLSIVSSNVKDYEKFLIIESMCT